jgi:hypothetical protein
VSAVPELSGEGLTARQAKDLARQERILTLVSQGIPRKVVARQLGINPRRVFEALERERQLPPDEAAARRLSREERHADQLLQALPFEERHEYELEGIVRIMIGGLSIADEDYDPTPAPEGCPSCWRGPGALDGALDGGPCQNCPDPEAKQRCRLKRREQPRS